MDSAPMQPVTLWRYMGEAFAPTDQQSAVIGAEPGPLLVVAGAGAGKTETMASRVVWMVANGYVRPEEVLGLTFTKKAARELGKRIRQRLERLAANEQLVRRLDPSGGLAERLTVIAPTVATYDSYAGNLVREYGLLVPVEPDSRLITDAELHSVARDVVTNYRGDLMAERSKNDSVSTVVANLLSLYNSLGNELADREFLTSHSEQFIEAVHTLPKGPKQHGGPNQKVLGWCEKQRQRVAYFPLVDALREELRARGLVTFNEQMSVAAKMARDHPEVGASQRSRFRVVMLDEYQDTSHSQRILLRSLFGKGLDDHAGIGLKHPLTVTAVGDPMQAIYGWRGATAENLAAFVQDFPAPGLQPAPKLQLTTSWRNPPEVLELANHVSSSILGAPGDVNRPVEPLESKPDALPGRVELAYYATAEEEIDAVADAMAEEYRSSEGDLSAAVLVRKNRQSIRVADALEKRGVPYEIVGVAGLLTVPEIQDIVAVMTMLVRPEDSAAALRILGGPACGLGVADIVALAQRAANLAGRTRATESNDDEPNWSALSAEQRLAAQLEEIVRDADVAAGDGEHSAGLADAIADLGEPERYSAEGLARLQLLSSRLRELRLRSLGKPLADLVDDIVRVFHIRTEVLARASSTGTVHLDRFADVAQAYPGADPEGFLDYLAMASEYEGGLEPGSVSPSKDRVQILTAHKAKGLEWDCVAVIHADDKTYSTEVRTFLKKLDHFPPHDFAVHASENRKEFEDYCLDFEQARKDVQAEETARLFYVAITRAAKRLMVTAAGIESTRQKAAQPYEHFEALKTLAERLSFPGIVVSHWWDGMEDGERAELTGEQGQWPQYPVREAHHNAARLVREAMDEMPEAVEGELYGLWEADTTALIEEHLAALSPQVEVALPGELTASDVVALSADAEQFARRARRPVPFKPNSYAKRGTAFHEWIESFYGARPLLSEDELPGIDEQDVDEATLARLKANFENSHWASKAPVRIEHPFEIALGQAVVRGRIDAVFEDADGWVVVDWKTGSKPAPNQMESAKLQLAVYREAWRRYADDGKDVRAKFFYVRTGEDFAPVDLPDKDELEQLLRDSAATGLEFDEEKVR